MCEWCSYFIAGKISLPSCVFMKGCVILWNVTFFNHINLINNQTFSQYPSLIFFSDFFLIVLSKELDYEQLKEVNLMVSVSNKAAYHKSVVIDRTITYPIKIKVVNVPETPHFNPVVKVISISEDRKTIILNKVITTYTATDSDTLLIATNVRWEIYGAIPDLKVFYSGCGLCLS